MGKKSKRNRGQKTPEGARSPPALRNDTKEEETKDNLRFEDPYVEEIIEDRGDEDDDDG